MNFAETVGCTITLRHKDKMDRLQAAMTDLQVVIRGCSLVDPMAPSQFLQSVESLARSCAMFLRKTVIGDRGDRRTRLLDDETCQSLGLGFNKIRLPAGEGETFEIIAADIRRGVVEIVPVDELAKSHGGPYLLPFGPRDSPSQSSGPSLARWTGPDGRPTLNRGRSGHRSYSTLGGLPPSDVTDGWVNNS